LIDGYDVSKVELYSLRRQIGVVLQDTLLFDGTVQENIALTNPDASAEEIVEAAKIAFAHDFIMTLPNGYNSRVGERGSALSGGQRQRIAIARTILQNPRLLVLDEATSALDYHAERQVCSNLAEAFAERTVFFITHRLATIQRADVILMMDQGSVVEQGTHEELMALKGRYFYLYQQQQVQL
jgi:ATP-binding cassette subfamily B protein